MGPLVLIVDDEPATLAGLAALVEGARYSVAIAANYAEGRRLLTQLPVELVIVDVRLGEYNGLQLLVLAQDLPHPPAGIVTSGFQDRVLAQEAERLGAPYVLKPIEPARFLATVGDLLARRRH